MNIVKKFLKTNVKDGWDNPSVYLQVSKFSANNNAVGKGRNQQNEVLELTTQNIEIKEWKFVGSRLYIRSSSKNEKYGLIVSNKTITFSHEEFDSLIDIYGCNGKGRESTKKEVEEIVRNFLYEYSDADQEFREAFFNKLKIDDLFIYTHCFYMDATPKFTIQKSNNIELGFKTNSTYNSLPYIMRFVVAEKENEYTKLRDIGIETRGYYDHYDNMLIHKSQIKEAKTFHNAFKRKIKRYESNTLKKVAKLK